VGSKTVLVLGGGASEMLAYGTAIVVEEAEGA
jgi:hypothetical protein